MSDAGLFHLLCGATSGRRISCLFFLTQPHEIGCWFPVFEWVCKGAHGYEEGRLLRDETVRDTGSDLDEVACRHFEFGVVTGRLFFHDHHQATGDDEEFFLVRAVEMETASCAWMEKLCQFNETPWRLAHQDRNPAAFVCLTEPSCWVVIRGQRLYGDTSVQERP